MKKLLLFLLVFPALLYAAPVDPNMAQQVACNFLGIGLSAQGNKPNKLRRVAQQAMNNPQYYIFNNEDGGFVIVSGDDCATPILGYSNEGSIDLDDLPIQLEELLQAYAMEIQEAVDLNLQATNEVAEEWTKYRRTSQSHKATAIVSPLIVTSWAQYPRYNNKCPVDASLANMGGHPSTGCVATAMAQIMKYWEYPKKGYDRKSYRSEHYGTLSADFGSTAYDWDNMPLKLTSSTSATQNNAVATLMYHCGVAVSMNYNSDGHGSSSANTLDWGGGRASAETALKTYFGYISTLEGKQSSSMSASAWKSLLKTELDNRRPMLYRGVSSQGGHCFVCDGYDNSDKFHFNWGWGGSSNGFFSLTAGTSGSHEFTQDQCAVIGIKPKDGTSPAKNYDLYMNTDLTAINTSSSTSSEPNAYYFGNTMSFTAKVENNGTGVFNGSLKVGAFNDNGEFIAWSNESYHFSLNAGKYTAQYTYTFNGGNPFVPGKYRAYMYYQDDDEAESKLVKTDEGIFLTEYNNIAFTVKSSGSLQPVSAYRLYDEPFDNTFILGQNARVNVSVKNISASSAFYGKIRLCLYELDGTIAAVLDEMDYTSGIPANTTYDIPFIIVINGNTLRPGTYHMALEVKSSNQSTWAYMGCNATYPNPINVIVKAPNLHADEYEVNNTQAKATTLIWEIDEEMEDFSSGQVSLHEDADIDYYKLSFPKSKRYKVTIRLYDKYHQGGYWYENADAEYSYSVGGNTYCDYSQVYRMFTFNGPATLYMRVRPFGMNGLGYYELLGEIEESELNDIDNIETTNSPAKVLRDGKIYILRGDKTYTITGTEIK